MPKVFKSVTDPATGRMRTVEVDVEDAQKKLQETKDALKEMLYGKAQFHDDPYAAPKPEPEPEIKHPCDAKSGDWVAWDGSDFKGPFNFPINIRVRIKARDGRESPFDWPAVNVPWRHSGFESDVVAYKVVS